MNNDLAQKLQGVPCACEQVVRHPKQTLAPHTTALAPSLTAAGRALCRQPPTTSSCRKPQVCSIAMLMTYRPHSGAKDVQMSGMAPLICS